MSFVSRQQVRFAHVDAAGIVFYPRYFEMLNAAIEDYFAQHIGVSFAAMHIDRGIGVPTVHLEVDFTAPSRLGDMLEWALDPVRVGRSSAEFRITARCEAEMRLTGRVLLVCMALDRAEALPWPEDMHPRE